MSEMPGTFEAARPIPRSSSSVDGEVLEAVEWYLGELEAGRRPDREAFFARHPHLRDRLASFLESLEFVHDIAPQLRDASESTSDAVAGALPSDVALGDFRILRELGRGGMGIVYEAEQLSLGRRVALKVLPLAGMLSEMQLKRFKNEARAAALLDHPNIVSVYSVGCERSVHFYAMQLIEGQSLAEVIDRMRSSECGVRNEEQGTEDGGPRSEVGGQPDEGASPSGQQPFQSEIRNLK